MDRVVNALKRHAGILDHGHAQPRFGLVTSYDPATAAARVTLQPEGVLSGWLPVLSAWTGAGWGLICPPSPGNQVVVLSQEGDAQHGVIIGGTYSNSQPPPATPAGEIWLVHQTGTFLKLCNDGTVQVQGDLHVSGDIYDSKGSLSRMRSHYDSHTHIDSRGGTTTTPNQQD